jgi:hypothetical protein
MPPRFFTNTAEAGIEPYSGENTAAALGDYLTFRTQVLSGALSLSPAVCAFRVQVRV